jgi:hypothetical protein
MENLSPSYHEELLTTHPSYGVPGKVREAGELCAPFGRLPFGSVNTQLPTSVRFMQIACGDFGNPGNVIRNAPEEEMNDEGIYGYLYWK